jgi:amidase
LDAAELAFAGIARQAELVREGEISSRELMETCLARITRIGPRVNAFRVVLGERALAEADQANARRTAGEDRPLLGVPVAIKDGVDVAGEVTTHGTGAYGAPAAEDAEIVKRLRSAGAVVIGKTHLPELALWPFTESATWGVTRNPWDLGRTPGGSSGGTAAAVAAGLVPGGQASDGGGSIRIPAAACGLFGLKPQRGRVSLAPDAEHWHGLTSFGVLTRGVRDTALMLDVVAGPGPGDADRPPSPERPFADAARERPPRLRIAVSLKPSVPVPVDDEVRDAVEGTASLLRAIGHDVRDRDPAWGAIGNAFVPRYLRGGHDDAQRMAHPHRLERRTRSLARLGAAIPPALVARARAAEASHAARLNALFEDHDLLLTPVVPQPPAELGRWEGRGALATMAGVSIASVPFTTPWNATGQPAASIPAGFTSAGLPLAVQLVGRPNDEATLLSVAAEIESERPWGHHRPPV